MRHRKISMLEERISLVVGSREGFVKNRYSGDEIIYRSRMVGPIRDRKTAFDSVYSVTHAACQVN